MRRKAFLTMAVLALLVTGGATGAWAAAPFGWFGGLARAGNAGNGVVGVQGWALADTGVFAVDIVVDGVIIGRANYGRSRPGVSKLHPGLPDSAAPGFGYQLDTTHFLNGMHTVTARVTSRAGEVAYLNSDQLQFTNTTHDLLPFGKIEFPNQGAEMPGNCTKTGPPLFSVISGYALDVNTQNNKPGVAYVELLIDGAITFNSRHDCHFNSDEGGLSDCYGLRRPDLEQNFPGLKDAPHAGFHFALNVGSLISAPDPLGPPPLYTRGSHQLTIRVGDQFEQVTDIASVAVDFVCNGDLGNNASIGQIDFPITGLLYGGIIQVSGWAVDLECVLAVQIFVDGIPQFPLADYGQPRPDIASLYPSYLAACPQNPGPGWFTYIDTTQLSNGTHELSALVIDFANPPSSTFIGKFPFTVANPIP